MKRELFILTAQFCSAQKLQKKKPNRTKIDADNGVGSSSRPHSKSQAETEIAKEFCISLTVHTQFIYVFKNVWKQNGKKRKTKKEVKS